MAEVMVVEGADVDEDLQVTERKKETKVPENRHRSIQ